LMDLYKKSQYKSVRRAVLGFIEDMDREADAVKTLTGLLKEEKDPDMRRYIISTLGDTGSDDAVPVLLDLAKNDENLGVRKTAVSALSDIGTEKARNALMQLVEKKTPVF
ncbi:MAG: HEAT repeat domain-containing protein, partial [Candidatus Aminicenantes bacterium]|nr:HEAT repeat domain-containing protein [Candidatus Aminicenantes bacterium]